MLIDELSSSVRSVRRLSKYDANSNEYSVQQIKNAGDKLEMHLRVQFDDNNKTINITQETAKTFVGIIHNTILERLISGEIEINI